MRRHDRGWRIAGSALMAAGYAVPFAGEVLLSRAGQQALAVLVGMPLAVTGALLMVQGNRVVRSLRVECGRHRELVLAVRRRRSRRRGA